jgi:hypothetical protein
MIDIHEMKRRETPDTPVLLFDCTWKDGHTERWSTHAVSAGGEAYSPRVVRHDGFELKLASEEGIDAGGRLAVTLVNTDSYGSQIERSRGWKGARLRVRAAFADLRTRGLTTAPKAVFLGWANPPEEISERFIRLSFVNRLSLQRTAVPQARVQPRCPWHFPRTAAERAEAVDGGARGRYSAFYNCGYSPGLMGGAGNLDGSGQPFTDCARTRPDCEARGMFSRDAETRETARFGGCQFLPPSIAVRSHGGAKWGLAEPADGRGRANDAVPLIYGTAWYAPPVIFSRSDGNLTHCQALLGSGPMEGVEKVIVNGVELPLGVDGQDMTATGWYNVVSLGLRNGAFNLNFADAAGVPTGDPHGGMAVLSASIPNRLARGNEVPRVEVLANGQRVPVYDLSGARAGEAFTRNPAWILLDLLKRCGWSEEEIDTASFSRTAGYCAEILPVKDPNGNVVNSPRFEINVALTERRSAAEAVRGIRNAAALMVTIDGEGRIRLAPEGRIGDQQPEKPEGSNSAAPFEGGWPAYEFSDGSAGFGAILRRADNAPAVRIFSRPASESPNRLSVEFQNMLNGYRQDTVSVVDLDDVLRTGQEVHQRAPGLGLPHAAQAARVLRLSLNKATLGNSYIDFETSFHAIGLRPGDIITFTYLKEGLSRAPFRVLRIVPAGNFERVRIVAQRHEEFWYALLDGGEHAGGAGSSFGPESGVPRPLAGVARNAQGEQEFGVTEQLIEDADGGGSLRLLVRFTPPPRPGNPKAGPPLLSLSPDVAAVGGTLPGGRVYYYAVSSVDGAGTESSLSFIVRASVPGPGNTNAVTLRGLSFPRSAAGFRVYRGANPVQTMRIAEVAGTAETFRDAGLAESMEQPPDPAYDRANFWWRMELLPETPVSWAGEDRVRNDALNLAPNEFQGALARVVAGAGRGQERTILSHTANEFLLSSAWRTRPDASSVFVVVERSWRFGAASRSSEVEFEVPNRANVVVQISGRSANSRGLETAEELSVLHRHRLLGNAGGHGDRDVPEEPAFALATAGLGEVTLSGIGFPALENTRSIEAATLILHAWNELNPVNTAQLGLAAGELDMNVTLQQPGPGVAGQLIQVSREIMQIVEVREQGLSYKVRRGACGSPQMAHAAGTAVFHLERFVTVVPFVRDFFSSPASGSFLYTVPVRGVRIGAAEFFVTNSVGDSPTARASYAGLAEGGLRTLEGGQYSIQLDGQLKVVSNAAPPLVVEKQRAVRDVRAIVHEAPVGGPVLLAVRRNGALYCELSISAGAVSSGTVTGFGRPPLQPGDEITLDVPSVPAGRGSYPGRGLTVLMRL